MTTDYTRQCSSCGGICRKSGCERDNIDVEAMKAEIERKRLEHDGLLAKELEHRQQLAARTKANIERLKAQGIEWRAKK